VSSFYRMSLISLAKGPSHDSGMYQVNVLHSTSAPKYDSYIPESLFLSGLP
jgi:hypothetical protein